jgi:hypothetical protein
LSKINTSRTKSNQGGPMDNKKIGLTLLILGIVLCLLAIAGTQMAVISFETGIGTVTTGGLSPVSVALIFVGIVFMAFGAYLRIKK